MKALEMATITQRHPSYPARLQTIYDPPTRLSMYGALTAADDVAIAIVGARHATPYGLQIAEHLAAELAAAHVTIVSGMARGIDAAAHRGALGAGGRTIAVLGSGLRRIYPPEHRALMHEIAAAGAVLSEFAHDSAPHKWHFLQRNRIISGLSLGVVVVEAAERSGALNTVTHAADQGRDVMAVPGRVTSALSAGTHALLRDGATLVTNAADICQAVGLMIDPARETPTAVEPVLPAEQQTLWQALTEDPQHIDAIAAQIGHNIAHTSSLLLQLELASLTRQWPGQHYTRLSQK